MTSNAAIVITGTRVVYQLPVREVTVQATNQGEAPVLVQAWIDNGERNSTPESVDTPFFVSPPIFRLDPQQGQSLRIAYTPSPDQPLPENKESVFWLNVLEIPPQQTVVDENTAHLNVALRTRLKIFLRPKGLPGKADNAADALLWRLVAGDQLTIECDNPTVFHVSMPTIEAVVGDQAIKLSEGIMVAPKNHATFTPIEATSFTGKPTQIRFSYINDFGVTHDRTAQLK